MVSVDNFHFPYDDALETRQLLLQRCSQYDFVKFDSNIFNSNLSIIHLNIRSAVSKMDEFSIWLLSLQHKPNILCFTETWYLRDTLPYQLHGYTVFNVPRQSGVGGGLCMYVNDTYRTSVLNTSIVCSTFEFTCIQFVLNGLHTIVCCIYKPPSTNATDFLAELATLLSFFQNNHPFANIVLTGDFNTDIKNKNNTDFTNLLLSSNLYPTIFFPTRVTNQSSTIIDNCFTNTQLDWKSGVLNCSLSDHYMIFLCINFPNIKVQKEKEYMHKQVDMFAFTKDVANLSWDFITDTSLVDSDCEKFILLLMNSLSKSTYTITSKIRFKMPWMTIGLHCSSLRKHELFKKAQCGEIPLSIYKNYRNKFTQCVRARKKQYYYDLCEQNKHNSRKIWQHVNSLLGQNHQSSENLVNCHDLNVINKFFSNLGPTTVADLPTSRCNYRDFITPVINSFVLSTVTSAELLNIINRLPNKCSCGFDGLNSYHLKSVAIHIANPLLQIVNKSFNNGIFPNVLKIARVTPVHKGGNSDQLINFRPISVLPTLSKIFERLIYNRLESFITKFHILSDYQFGFRKGHNTEMAVINAINYINKSIDSKVPVLALYIDISKAFDSLDHSILLEKMHLLGFRGTIHKLISSYLKSRYQYVESSGVKSNLCTLTKGVPQGSILGPLIFLLYINDLASLSPDLYFSLFADDTTIITADKSLTYTTQVVADRLTCVFDWFLANKLSVNVKKTHCMFFGLKKCVFYDKVTVNEHVINCVPNTKFLGLYIDNELTWGTHIENVCSQLSKTLGLIRVASHVLPNYVLRNLYYAYFASRLCYGICLWGNTFTTYLQPIRTLQNRCIRLISNADNLAHVPFIAKYLNLLMFDDLYYFHTAIFMYKVFHDLHPAVISHLFTKLSSMSNSIVTRHTMHDFFLPQVRLCVCKKFITYSGVDVWFKLDPDVKACTCLQKFKLSLLSMLLSKYV